MPHVQRTGIGLRIDRDGAHAQAAWRCARCGRRSRRDWRSGRSENIAGPAFGADTSAPRRGRRLRRVGRCGGSGRVRRGRGCAAAARRASAFGSLRLGVHDADRRDRGGRGEVHIGRQMRRPALFGALPWRRRGDRRRQRCDSAGCFSPGAVPGIGVARDVVHRTRRAFELALSASVPRAERRRRNARRCSPRARPAHARRARSGRARWRAALAGKTRRSPAASGSMPPRRRAASAAPPCSRRRRRRSAPSANTAFSQAFSTVSPGRRRGRRAANRAPPRRARASACALDQRAPLGRLPVGARRSISTASVASTSKPMTRRARAAHLARHRHQSASTSAASARRWQRHRRRHQAAQPTAADARHRILTASPSLRRS